MVSSILVNCYTFQIEADNYAVCVTIHTFYTIVSLLTPEHCTVYSFPEVTLLLMLRGTASNLAGGERERERI